MNNYSNLILQGILILSLGYFSFLDIRKKQLPRGWLLLAWIGFLFINIICQKSTFLEIVGGLAIGGFLLFISRVTRESIGYGDGMLVLVIGAAVGGFRTLLVLFYGLVISCIFCSVLLCFHKIEKKDTIPFAPFLFIAYLGVLVGC